MASQPKKKRANLSLFEKTIEESRKPGFKQSNAATHHDVTPGTSSHIFKDQERILSAHDATHLTPNSTKKNIVKGRRPEIEKQLYTWLIKQQKKGVPLSGPVLIAKVKDCWGHRLQVL